MAKANPRAAFALTMIAFLMALFFAGCGGKKGPEAVVATFNGEPLTLGYLEAKWAKLAKNDDRFKPEPGNEAKMDSVRNAVMDVIINKELIVDQAYKQNFVSDEVYQNALEGQRKMQLINLLKDREILKKMPEFTEEDYKSHYSLMGYQVKARHIDMDDEAEAKQLAQRLRDGELEFDEAVKEFSTNPDREFGGDLGTVSFGSNVKPVEDTLFAMEPGDISDPVETTTGWSIFIVDKKSHSDPPEYASVRESIKNRLEMRSMRLVGAEHAKRVMDKYGFEFNWDAARRIVELMPDDLTPEEVNNYRGSTVEKPILKFNEDELSGWLYEIEGKKYTLKEFSDEYDRLHPLARPLKQNRVMGVYNWAHREAINKLMPKEAIALGLDKDPEYMVIMKEFEEQACIGAVRKALVDAAIEVNEDDVKQWYEENPRYYTVLPQMRCNQVINAEEDKILEAFGKFQSGVPIDSIGAEYSVTYPDQWLTNYFTPDSTRAPGNRAIAAAQHLTEIGEATPPFEYQGYWAFMVLADTLSSRLMEFDEAKDKAERDLREVRSNERLDSLLTEWRADADIVIYDDVLKDAEPSPETMDDEVRI